MKEKILDRVITFFIQLLCKHNYRIPKELDDAKERSRLICELKEGQSISFSRLHVCTKCNKEQILGSGMYN